MWNEYKERQEVIEETMSALQATASSCTLDATCTINDKCKLLVNVVKEFTTLVDNKIQMKEEDTKQLILQQLKDRYHRTVSNLQTLI